MKTFSPTWKRSKRPRNQRKHRAKSPLHVKLKFAHAHLSKDLKKKYGKRSIGLRKGDKIKVMRGNFRKHEGKIEKIDLKNIEVFVNGIEVTKKDGTKKMVPIHPSNLVVTELILNDKTRQETLDRK